MHVPLLALIKTCAMINNINLKINFFRKTLWLIVNFSKFT